MDKMQALKQYFGHDEFRPGQETMVDAILAGQDALGIMPTGAGKSICYQLPALLLEGITLVISPLISLMKDQVAALKQMGVNAAYINSSLTPSQTSVALKRAALGWYKIIYVAPERLDVPEFLNFAFSVSISMLTVDEAHCISQWGQDFRPSYLKIHEFVEQLPVRPIVSAFTATATPKVQQDILARLMLRNPKLVKTGFDRPNLYFSILKPKDRYGALYDFLAQKQGLSGIIYCATRKTVEEVASKLEMDGFSSTRYHAGLGDAERASNQDDFQFDRKQIMVATNAFGMGIDKSNVSFVVHYNMPKNIESYYQEAGRAGRDGSPADCLLLYGGQDVITARWMIDHSDDNSELTPEERAIVRQNDLERLKQMTFYATSKRCLRQFILRYFGEISFKDCGYCSVCAKAEYEVNNKPDRKATATRKQSRESEKEETLRKERAKLGWSDEDEALYQDLVALRNQLAKQIHMPAYVVFANTSLRDMVDRKPKNAKEFLMVSGVGDAKQKQYGDVFLAVIKKYTQVALDPPSSMFYRLRGEPEDRFWDFGGGDDEDGFI